MDHKIYFIYGMYVRPTQWEALARYLTDSVDILGYWNYIPLLYMVKTRLRAAELRMKLDPLFPDGNFIVAEVAPYNVDGRLPQDAWSWLYSPPTEPGNRLGLLSLFDASKP